MTTIYNTTGSKAVNITTDATGRTHAMYVQIYKGQQQVLESKSFASAKTAEQWATNKINN